MIKKFKSKYLIAFVVIFSVGLIAGFFSQKSSTSKIKTNAAQNQVEESNSNSSANLPKFTLDQLAEFDGTDPNKPIYIGMDGLVYDVSEGRDYYKVDGAYHFLAGKDSSKDLHIAGGDIIKRKYPVIGTFSKE